MSKTIEAEVKVTVRYTVTEEQWAEYQEDCKALYQPMSQPIRRGFNRQLEDAVEHLTLTHGVPGQSLEAIQIVAAGEVNRIKFIANHDDEYLRNVCAIPAQDIVS